jgi:uncharacterized Zn-binding protein involved in type VI secretion
MVQKKRNKKTKERTRYIDYSEKIVVIAKCVEIIQSCEKERKHKKCYIPTGDHESCSSHKHKKCYIPTGDHESCNNHKHKKCYIPTGDHESCNNHKHKKCYIPTGDHESCSSHKHKKCNDFKKKKSKVLPDGLEPAGNSNEYVLPDAIDTNNTSTDTIISEIHNLFEEIAIPHVIPVKNMPKPLAKMGD